MRALTFGWEFPPETTGGLGIACQGLVRELSSLNIDVTFVLPRRQKVVSSPAKFVFADAIVVPPGTTFTSNYPVGSYDHSSTAMFTGPDVPAIPHDPGKSPAYQRLIDAVRAFAHEAASIAKREPHDVIHAHDWTSYLAGVAAKRASGRPLVLHVHATSFDQAGGANVDPTIYAIEKEAFAAADRIVTVSDLTRRVLMSKHGVDPKKIEVVYNGTEVDEPVHLAPSLAALKAAGKRIVVYHGRLTIQKGVDHLINAARMVVDYDPNVVFVISGSGDMEAQLMHQVGALGLSQNVIFAGALWGEDRDRLYQSADLVVMPSVSEPFGLVPLEALRHGAPALISKQSGVSEVVSHVLKVDFWDVEEMANKILATLKYPVLHKQLKEEGRRELGHLSWARAAEKIRELYQRLMTWAQGHATT